MNWPLPSRYLYPIFVAHTRMKKVLHVSTECYPAAKEGGMGDVVGALPNYFQELGFEASVIIPRYNLPWFNNQEFTLEYKGFFYLGTVLIGFKILKLMEGMLSYPFYCIDIPGKFDRDTIYLNKNGEGFADEASRNICFQRSVVLWLNHIPDFFQIIHCHDHQTGLIPFMMYKCIEFESLRQLPTYFTIHNASYQGQMSWQVRPMLPAYWDNDYGWLEWDNRINSMACAIKCCWRYSTVSPSYLYEIRDSMPSISGLLQSEAAKGSGILNGIDDVLWNPKTDEKIHFPLKKNWLEFKSKNKNHLCEKLKLDPSLPLFSFIGRLVYQKGADIIPGAIEALFGSGMKANFVILGSGTKKIEEYLGSLQQRFPANVQVLIMYNETAAHQIYASSDFLLMPSRFEPCGLNQLFAMRYGTIPLAHHTGGLKDTVKDVSAPDGTGFSFNDCNAHALALTMMRALVQYNDKKNLEILMRKNADLDFSWRKSSQIYADEYARISG